MGIDYNAIAQAGGIGKGEARIVGKKRQKRIENAEWRAVCEQVDRRDKRRCRLTGVVLSAGAVDPAQRLERHHLELRSRNKERRWTATNVLTISALVHQAIHAGLLRLLDKAGRLCLDERKLDHVAWSTALPIDQQPFKVTKVPVLKRRD